MTESPMTETMMLEIDSIAVGGDGVARQDGLVVFVPRTAPGDRVVARIERGKRFARGIAERVEQPSPSRTDPSCAHYLIDHCGGCQLQHMTLDAQHEAKRGSFVTRCVVSANALWTRRRFVRGRRRGGIGTVSPRHSPAR